MENLFDLYGKKSYTFVIIMDESKLYKKGDDTVLHYYFDPTYILVIIGIIISMAASANVNGSFRKYSRVLARRGVRAEQAAETILRNAGIYDVTIQHVSGNLTDHYDPRSKTLRLSDSVYGSSSVSAIGVAAHECGHAIQHDSGYVPLKLRGALVPVVNFASRNREKYAPACSDQAGAYLFGLRAGIHRRRTAAVNAGSKSTPLPPGA